MAREVARGPSEGRALVHLMVACALLFVASLPNALARGPQSLAIEDAVEGAVSAHLFAYLALAPLLAYGFAAAVHLVARAFGGEGRLSRRPRRRLLVGAARRAARAGARACRRDRRDGGAGAVALARRCLGYAVFAAWLWFFAASLAEAEGFTATGRVAVVAAAVLGAGSRALRAGRRRIGNGRMWRELLIDSLKRPRAAARRVLDAGIPAAAAARGRGARRRRRGRPRLSRAAAQPRGARRRLGGGHREPAPRRRGPARGDGRRRLPHRSSRPSLRRHGHHRTAPLRSSSG